MSEGGGVVEAKGPGGVEDRGGFEVDLLVHSEESQRELCWRLIFASKATYRLRFQTGIRQLRASDISEVLDNHVRLRTRVSAALGFYTPDAVEPGVLWVE